MNDEITLLFTLLCLVLTVRSWWIHFIVKDGLARLMLLWGCGFLALFFIFRILNLVLFLSGTIDLVQSRIMATYNVWFIFAIVIGQTLLQSRRVKPKDNNKQLKNSKNKDKK